MTKYIHARPLYHERRVKLILISVFFAAVLTVIQTARVFAADYVRPPGRVNLIRTTHNEESYSVLECSGTKISAIGRYADGGLRKMYILKHEDESGSYSMHANKDGSYTAELTMKPEEGVYSLVLMLNTGASMHYRVYYDEQNGWYFPLNGLDRTNRNVFEHIYEAPDEAAALYLSANDDPEEINTALEQIRQYARSVTEGIDDDYQKARAISRFIADSFYYDQDARTSDASLDTIALYNVLKRGRTVCGGFANMFCAMAEAVGIDAVNIKGGTTGGGTTYDALPEGPQNHEFAAFWYEKEKRWVWEDACWDGAGSYENGEFKPADKREMYFDITDETFALNHRADKAERRHYFAAAAETAPLTDVSAAAPEPADSAEISPVQTSADILSEAESAAAQTETPAAQSQSVPSVQKAEQDNTIYIVIIAVLALLVVIAAVIVIKTISNGRKNQNGNNRT